MRQKQETIQFLGATEKADIMDVAKIIIDDVKSNRYMYGTLVKKQM